MFSFFPWLRITANPESPFSSSGLEALSEMSLPKACWVTQHVAEENKSLHAWEVSDNVGHPGFLHWYISNVLTVFVKCKWLRLQWNFSCYLMFSLLIFSLPWPSQIKWACFDLRSHSCNLLMPPRSRGMALTAPSDCLGGCFKVQLTDTSIPFKPLVFEH